MFVIDLLNQKKKDKKTEKYWSNIWIMADKPTELSAVEAPTSEQ